MAGLQSKTFSNILSVPFVHLAKICEKRGVKCKKLYKISCKANNSNEFEPFL